MNSKIKLVAIALMTGAIAVGTQSCSDDDNETTGDGKVTGITVDPTSQTLLIGGTHPLTAAVFPSNATDKSVTWASDNTSVATVNADGLVTAIAVGEANITVTSVDNPAKTATCAITVNASFSISLDKTSMQIAVNATGTLVATITPNDASKTIVWSTSSPTVATVADGTVTGIATGTATITAALSDDPNAKAECVVTVVGEEDLLVGEWTFEDDTDLEKATKGADLEISGYTSIAGPGSTKAVEPGDDAYITVHHNIGANGGGQNTNVYTLMMDIRGSQDDFNGWLSVFDGDGSEADLWIDGPNGGIGFAELGGYKYDIVEPDTWYRLVIAANLAEESFLVYLNGELVFTASPKQEGGYVNYDIDSRVSLDPATVLLGTDGTGYPGPQFAEVRMWSVQLTAEQIAELGRP
jgi:hypothetical protein